MASRVINLSSPVPYLSFEERQTNREIFADDDFPVGSPLRRFENDHAVLKYDDLCLRGFVVEGTLVPQDSGFAEVFRLLDRIEWAYTVLHVRPFYPRIV